MSVVQYLSADWWFLHLAGWRLVRIEFTPRRAWAVMEFVLRLPAPAEPAP